MPGPLLDRYWNRLQEGGEDPRQGLPDPVFDFARAITPMINVDLLIGDTVGRHLLAWREDEYSRGWHVPGGIVRYREACARRVAEVARLEIGVAVRSEPAPCHLIEFLDGARGHFIALLFRCHLVSDVTARHGLIVYGETPRPGQLAWCEGVPPDLYPAHEAYRDWLTGVGRDGIGLSTVGTPSL